MYKNQKIGVVIPAYNEECFVKEVIETIPSFVDRKYVTNDASTDNTGNVLASIADERLVVINHRRRGGTGAAIISGYNRALEDNMDVIAVMGGDGQMNPAMLTMILSPVIEGKAEYTKGDRISIPRNRKGMPTPRLLGNFIFTFLTRIASGYWHILDVQNGYTAISGKVLRKIDLNKIAKGYAFENDILVKLNVLGARVLNVPHQAKYGKEKSKLKFISFIPRTSWLLLKAFLWRLRMKYASPSSSEGTITGINVMEEPRRPYAEIPNTKKGMEIANQE